MRCMSSFPACFLASRDFYHISLIFSSSLEKFLTMLFTLDSLSASLSPCGMLLKIITSFMVYLTLFASAINSWQFTLEIHPYKASCIVTKKYLFYRIKYRTPPRYILTQWYHRYVEYNTYRIQSTGYLKKGQLFKILFRNV